MLMEPSDAVETGHGGGLSTQKAIRTFRGWERGLNPLLLRTFAAALFSIDNPYCYKQSYRIFSVCVRPYYYSQYVFPASF